MWELSIVVKWSEYNSWVLQRYSQSEKYEKNYRSVRDIVPKCLQNQYSVFCVLFIMTDGTDDIFIIIDIRLLLHVLFADIFRCDDGVAELLFPVRGYLRFYFRSRDGCRPSRLLFDLRLIGKSYGPSRDGRAAAVAAAATARSHPPFRGRTHN